MNRDEAKIILQLYRPNTADVDDLQIAEALALAKGDPELARWLEEHSARQNMLREKFRQIEIPAGLKEQIISEQAARTKTVRRRETTVAALAAAAIVIALIFSAQFWLSQHRNDSNMFSNYQNQMVNFATSPYGMSFVTNDLRQIQNYLAQNHGATDYTLPASLERTAATGCAIKYWSGMRVSMICFRTGKSLPPNQQGDLWLFVVDRAFVKDAPDDASPQFAKVNQFITATWTQGGKLYLLATEGDEQAIRKFL